MLKPALIWISIALIALGVGIKSFSPEWFAFITGCSMLAALLVD